MPTKLSKLWSKSGVTNLEGVVRRTNCSSSLAAMDCLDPTGTQRMSIEPHRASRSTIDVFESPWISWPRLPCVDNTHSGTLLIPYPNCDKSSTGATRVHPRKTGKVVMTSEIVDPIPLKMVSLAPLALVLSRPPNLDSMWATGLGVATEKWGHTLDEVTCKVPHRGTSQRAGRGFFFASKPTINVVNVNGAWCCSGEHASLRCLRRRWELSAMVSNLFLTGKLAATSSQASSQITPEGGLLRGSPESMNEVEMGCAE